jgi:hypothetical protein
MIPNTPDWGLVANERFGTAAKPYFRTAIHEIGHAMGLYHNTVDNGFMNTTDVIAASATPANPFPNNIQWSHATDDQKRLRHMPDIYVRPGGTPFGTSYATTPISPDDLESPAEELQLEVSPVLEAVPVGAPVRVNVVLKNVSDHAVVAPAKIGLSVDVVRGRVVGPQGLERTFSPLQLCVDDQPLGVLAPGESVAGSLTLLRGGEGALFPSSGMHTVEVTVTWHVAGIGRTVQGRTGVMVTPVADDAHARAAARLLSTPDVHLALVLGGDHLEEGIAALQTALDNPVLRPHYAYVEFKRRAQRFGRRRPEVDVDLIDDSTVMSQAEMSKLDRIAKDAVAVGQDAAASKLKGKVKRVAPAAQDGKAKVEL